MTDIPIITQEEAVEVRARELLATEWDKEECPMTARAVRRSPDTLPVKVAIRAIAKALSPNMDHAVGGVRDSGIGTECIQRLRKIADSGRALGSNSNMMLTTFDAGVILRALSAVAPPVNQDAVREALKMLRDASLATVKAILEHDGRAALIAGNEINNMIPSINKLLATPPLDNTGLDAATVERPDGAIENLTNFQQQADMHGEFVKVSRQALDETLAYVAALASGDRS